MSRQTHYFHAPLDLGNNQLLAWLQNIRRCYSIRVSQGLPAHVEFLRDRIHGVAAGDGVLWLVEAQNLTRIDQIGVANVVYLSDVLPRSTVRLTDLIQIVPKPYCVLHVIVGVCPCACTAGASGRLTGARSRTSLRGGRRG
jgi:hypothetical protein